MCDRMTGGNLMKKIETMLIIACLLLIGRATAWGATYYSQGSVTPNTLTNWNTVRAGGGSSPANFTAGDIFVIQNTHTMTTTANWSISGTGSRLWIENGGTLQANDTVTLATATTFQMDGGGTYIQNVAMPMGSRIFQGTESFASSSTIEIRIMPTGTSAPSSPGWGNVTINQTTGSTALGWGGSLATIQGNLTILGTGTGTTRHAFTATGAITVSIGGNFTVTGGNFWLSSGTGTCTVNLTGNFIVNGGTLDIANSSGVGTINVGGNTTISSGTLTEGGTTTTSKISFNKAGTQTYTKSGGTISNTVNFDIASGSTLDMGTNVLDGSGGTFTLSSGATLGIGSTAGITSSGASGNIQVSGTRTFATDANYTYNSSSAQNTGNGLPSTVNNVTIDNSSGVTLDGSTTINGALTLTSGNLTLGSNNLTLGASATVSGSPSASNMIVATGSGELRKTFAGTGSFTFPVGDNTVTAEYSPVTLDFTSGTFSSAYAGVKLVNAKHPNNTSSTDYINRYWTVTSSGISSFSCNASFVYVGADVAGTEGNLYCGSWGGSSWTLLNAVNTGTKTLSGSVSSFSDFTGGESAALPVQLTSFSATANRLDAVLRWATATEVANFGFEIERRTIQNAEQRKKNWKRVGFVEGAGTSNAPRDYSFIDKNVAPGRYAYRIKQIDHDGTFEYFGDAEVEIGLAPKKFALESNYPNPFNPVTTIEFTLPEDGRAVLSIYNTLGQQVAVLFNGEGFAGRIVQTKFDAGRFPSGIYFSRLEFGGKALTRKMLLVR